MKPEIKTANDLLDSLNGLAHRQWTEGEVEQAVAHAAAALPRSAREALVSLALEKLRSNPERAPLVLATFAIILLKSYDGTPLTLSEWKELRDLVRDCADELDMDIVTYVMSLVMEYRAMEDD
ncbi:MAG: hypothetical protein N3A02_03695 [Rectinema sp.]|nr:hypothetical protein [Rectinema sp.]